MLEVLVNELLYRKKVTDQTNCRLELCITINSKELFVGHAFAFLAATKDGRDIRCGSEGDEGAIEVYCALTFGSKDHVRIVNFDAFPDPPRSYKDYSSVAAAASVWRCTITVVEDS